MLRAGASRDAVMRETGDLDTGLERSKSAKGSQRRRRSPRAPKKLQRNLEKRAYSFSPGRNDSIRVPSDIHRQHPVPPLPASVVAAGHPTAAGAYHEKGNTSQEQMAAHRATSLAKLDGQEWQRPPTLTKRSAPEGLPRRKSSKKRKEDHDRAVEVRAMSASMPSPLRPAVAAGWSGRPMKRDSKTMRDGLNRHLENPVSDISLPMQDSLHSSLSSDSEPHTSYTLSALGAFSPRPTLRYAENPRYVPGASGWTSDRSDGKRRISDRAPIPEETIKANKYVDDFADDLDASGIRELMERDRRRKEKKVVADRMKMERRLARRGEKQRMAESVAAQNGTPIPQNMERGALGREGLGIGEASGSGIGRRSSDASGRVRGSKTAGPMRAGSTASAQRDPFSDDNHSDGSLVDEQDVPVLGTAQVARLSRISMSPPSSPKGHRRDMSNISAMVDINQQIAEERPVLAGNPESVRQSSENSVRQPQSWVSFFRRTPKAKRTSTTSSFSNVSRDSLPTQQSQAAFVPVRKGSGVPKRTMSKFREDLPELPLSPPDSRVQSPETDVVPPIRTAYHERRAGARGPADSNPFADQPQRTRHDTPTSGYRSLESAARLRTETPTSGHRSTDVPSPDPPAAVLSQSLASIDSEGSWLSGRPAAGSKRGSKGSTQLSQPALRDSASSVRKPYKDFTDSAEELGIAEDEYFSRLTPGPEDSYRISRQISGHAIPSSDEEENASVVSPTVSQTKWHGGAGRQPTLVHHDARAKSREGLLNDYQYDSGSEGPGETPMDLDRRSYPFDDLHEPSTVQRATSVDMGRAHVRRISAGSARLLDLKPRESGEAKRMGSS